MSKVLNLLRSSDSFFGGSVMETGAGDPGAWRGFLEDPAPAGNVVYPLSRTLTVAMSTVIHAELPARGTWVMAVAECPSPPRSSQRHALGGQ